MNLDLVMVQDWNSLSLRSEGQSYLSKFPKGAYEGTLDRSWSTQLHPFSSRQRRCHSESETSSFQPIIAPAFTLLQTIYNLTDPVNIDM